MFVLKKEDRIVTTNGCARQPIRGHRISRINHSRPRYLRKARYPGLGVIYGATFEVPTDRHSNHHWCFPIVAGSPTYEGQLVPNLVHCGPDVVEELNLNHRLQTPRRH